MAAQPPHCAREASMQRFTELKVWQRGHALVLEIYRVLCYKIEIAGPRR